MFLRFLALFIFTPLAELAILVYLGTVIGAWYTLLIVILTAIAGAVLARSQGLATISRIRGNLERGIMPSDELFNGALILMGGLLLLTPGLITDLVGFSLLIPPTRRALGNWLRKAVRRRIEMGKIHYVEIR
jgi:UPF0716 protein FxsA